MQDSPYQSPQANSALDPHQQFTPPPGAIKTFGVLHLVVAGLGLLCNVGGSLMSMFFMGPMMEQITANLPEQEKAQLTGVSSFMAEITNVMWFYVICGIILTVMLVIAGMGLLKNRESGLRMSVKYAWTSIITKIIYGALSLIYVVPATNRMYESMPEMKDNAAFLKMSGSMNAVGQIFSTAMYCIYPILVLIILNSRQVKDYLRGR